MRRWFPRHQWAFSKHKLNRIIVNIGGIANITILHSKDEMIGFDTGPGNCLLDEWYEKNQNMANLTLEVSTQPLVK